MEDPSLLEYQGVAPPKSGWPKAVHVYADTDVKGESPRASKLEPQGD